MDEFTLRITINSTPHVLYNIWMDSEKHTSLTGSPATIDPIVGGRFTAWDDYISGENLELIPHHKIIQKWRTTDFKEDDDDSILEITFQALNEHTLLILHHHRIPDGQGADYEKGWEDYYLANLRSLFGDE